MGKVWLLALLALSAALPAPARDVHDQPKILPARGSIQAAFAPWDDVESLLADTVASARTQVLVQAYLLTSRKFAFSLIEAKQHGIDVRVLADGRQHTETPGSLLELLQQQGIPVWLETRYRNAHNKIVLIDADGGKRAKPVVITGSYNFTWGAQHVNAENLIVIRDHPTLARRFVSNWKRHLEQARPLHAYSGKQ